MGHFAAYKPHCGAVCGAGWLYETSHNGRANGKRPCSVLGGALIFSRGSKSERHLRKKINPAVTRSAVTDPANSQHLKKSLEARHLPGDPPCETGTSAGELRAEPRVMRLVNHLFRLDSQRLLSYLTSMRVLTLAVTPAISTSFWNTIYFYTASATAGNLSYDFARGRHCTVSAAASRRNVDAFLDLFTRKSPRTWRDSSEKRALSARRLFLLVVRPLLSFPLIGVVESKTQKEPTCVS